ncbi:CpsD/CapB family tyrosine-protein kinase [Aliikangiella sp. IMCC44653]
MNTLEKAFLKAMKEENSQDEGSAENALGITDASLKQHDRPRKNLVSPSKTGITNMEQQALFTRKQLVAKRLIHPKMKDATLLDHYRNLRTKLLSMSNKDNFVTLITSAVPNYDCSLVAANLAASFALDETKTSILVDGDIHQPRLGKLLEVENTDGLINYLEADDWDAKQILYKTGIPRLRFVPSGLERANSAEYFTSEKMGEFMQQLLNRYPDRFPIVYAPSIVNSADARILAELCDKVILVIPYGKCTEEEFVQAALTIGEDKFAGVVLNDF